MVQESVVANNYPVMSKSWIWSSSVTVTNIWELYVSRELLYWRLKLFPFLIRVHYFCLFCNISGLDLIPFQEPVHKASCLMALQLLWLCDWFLDDNIDGTLFSGFLALISLSLLSFCCWRCISSSSWVISFSKMSPKAETIPTNRSNRNINFFCFFVLWCSLICRCKVWVKHIGPVTSSTISTTSNLPCIPTLPLRWLSLCTSLISPCMSMCRHINPKIPFPTSIPSLRSPAMPPTPSTLTVSPTTPTNAKSHVYTFSSKQTYSALFRVTNASASSANRPKKAESTSSASSTSKMPSVHP